jgi:opacity protein-like surface antigen
MRTLLTILVAGLLACSTVGYANAQEGARFGMGVELGNQPTMVGMSYYIGEFDADFSLEYSPGNTSLTPAVLFTIQMTPAVFIEPYIGYHSTSDTEEYTGGGKWEMSGSDLLLGVGLIYALKPGATVSPILHPVFDYHMLDASVEMTEGGSTGKAEISNSAFSFGLGVGGLVNIKDGLYLTAEARFRYTSVGDEEITVSPAGDFVDDVDCSSSMIDTDMVVGMRFVF